MWADLRVLPEGGRDGRKAPYLSLRIISVSPLRYEVLGYIYSV